MNVEKALKVLYSGQVQGVGFRRAALTCANGLTVVGFVRNLADGRVEMLIQGREADLLKLMSRVDETMYQNISSKVIQECPMGDYSDFKILQ